MNTLSSGITLNDRTFAITVRDNNLASRYILEGDTAILEFRQPRDGDNVLFRDHKGDEAFATFTVNDGNTTLVNDIEVITANNQVIQGVIVGLTRSIA